MTNYASISHQWTRDLKPTIGSVVAFYPVPGAATALRVVNSQVWISTFSPCFSVRLSLNTGAVASVQPLDGWGSAGIFVKNRRVLIPTTTTVLVSELSGRVESTMYWPSEDSLDRPIDLVPPSAFSALTESLIMATTESTLCVMSLKSGGDCRIVRLGLEPHYVTAMQLQCQNSVTVSTSNADGAVYQVDLQTLEVASLGGGIAACGNLVSTASGLCGVSLSGVLWPDFKWHSQLLPTHENPAHFVLRDFSVARYLIAGALVKCVGNVDSEDHKVSILSALSLRDRSVVWWDGLNGAMAMSLVPNSHSNTLVVLSRQGVFVLSLIDDHIEEVASVAIPIEEEASLYVREDSVIVLTRSGVVSLLKLHNVSVP